MSFRLQLNHLEVFVEFMESNPEFARGRLSVSNAREKFKELWSQLTTKLNSLGLGERNVEKWQKTWSDYKGNLKKKATELKHAQQATGGGPPPSKSLTELEIRILNLFGKTFYGGVGVEERGLNVKNNGTTSGYLEVDIEKGPPPMVVKQQSGIESIPSTSGIKRPREEDGSQHQYQEDHDYLYFRNDQEKKKKKETKLDSAYERTILALKSIENTVKEGLNNINGTLKDGLEAIKNNLQK